MKILLTTLNSKYIHSNLAIKYLKGCLKNNFVETREFTINEDIEDIFYKIINEGYDIVAFSCYIWNIEKTLKIAENIKKANPDITILFGGPEVSYEVKEFMTKNSFVDIVISGEGEKAFLEFNNILFEFKARLLNDNKLFTNENFISSCSKKFDTLPNFYYRDRDNIINNFDEKIVSEYMVIRDMEIVPFAYDDIQYEDIENKIVYYETSRGCTFNCSYCLSATSKGIRFFDEDRVFNELEKLVKMNVKQIKFVDRTFNSDSERAKRLVKFLMKIDNGNINFHFEITAYLLKKDFLDIIEKARVGLFQFEIGVQSTNPNTLFSVNRADLFEKIKENVEVIQSYKNTHLHLDLIAGLPFENYDSFINSFNMVFSLKPDALQLGFLKLLKGSPIYYEVEKYNYVYRDYPPYEIIKNKFISINEIIILKKVENVLDRYYNKGRYKNSINYLSKFYCDNYYSLFYELAYLLENNDIDLSKKNEEFFGLLLLADTIKSKKFNKDFFVELLRFDYLMMGRNPNLPNFLKAENISNRESIFEIIKGEDTLKELCLDKYSPKEAFKRIHWSNFSYDILKFTDFGDIIFSNNVIIINYEYDRKGDENFRCIRRMI